MRPKAEDLVCCFGKLVSLLSTCYFKEKLLVLLGPYAYWLLWLLTESADDMQTSSLGFSFLPCSLILHHLNLLQNEWYFSAASSKESSTCFSSVLKNLQALTPLQKTLLNKSTSNLKTLRALSVALISPCELQQTLRVLCNSVSERKGLLQVLHPQVIGAKVLGEILLCKQGKVWQALFFLSLVSRTKSGLSSHSNRVATTVRRKRPGLSRKGWNIQ